MDYTACQQRHSVLFTTAIDAINNLVAAQATHRLKAELHRYLSPATLILDEIGHLPLGKPGADLHFQLISQRYERGSTLLTTNKADKNWPPRSSTTTPASPAPSSTVPCTTSRPSCSKAKASA